jgi:hypothetical protein
LQVRRGSRFGETASETAGSLLCYIQSPWSELTDRQFLFVSRPISHTNIIHSLCLISSPRLCCQYEPQLEGRSPPATASGFRVR